MLNLLLNAAQAIGGQRAHRREHASRRTRQRSIEVRDTARGFPRTSATQVFEPFFTTKARGGGLGLPIARRTAELHGGSLTLACPDEGGTVVTTDVAARSPPWRHERHRAVRARIVRTSAESILSRLGQQSRCVDATACSTSAAGFVSPNFSMR